MNAGGVVVTDFSYGHRFKKDYGKLTVELQNTTIEKLDDLKSIPRLPGLRFEKLKGYTDPDIYTIHITGNYKLSMSIDGSTALLRRVGNHDDIDRSP